MTDGKQEMLSPDDNSYMERVLPSRNTVVKARTLQQDATFSKPCIWHLPANYSYLGKERKYQAVIRKKNEQFHAFCLLYFFSPFTRKEP